MTAKEMSEDAFDFKEGYEMYRFTEESFKDFCEQLCREQREICADAEAGHNLVMIEDVAGDLFMRQNDILNAPMPEL